MQQELFAIKGPLGIRGLPGWLAKRQYNVIRFNLRDRIGTAMIGLGLDRGGHKSNAGVICIYDRDVLKRVTEICRLSCREKPIMVDARAERTDVDTRTAFLRQLAINENLMDEDRAFTITCLQMGISEDEGDEFLDFEEEAVVMRVAR